MGLMYGLDLLGIAIILSDGGSSSDEKSLQSLRTTWPPIEMHFLRHDNASERDIRATSFVVSSY